MGNKTIYVQDERLWQKAKKLAGKEGLSRVIAKALEDFVATHDRQTQGFRRYQFEVAYASDDNDEFRPIDYVAFEAKPIFTGVLIYDVPDHLDIDPPDDRVRVDVYQTGKGTLVLTARHLEAPDGQLLHYGSFRSMDELIKDSVVSNLAPTDRAKLLTELASQLRDSLVIWID